MPPRAHRRIRWLPAAAAAAPLLIAAAAGSGEGGGEGGDSGSAQQLWAQYRAEVPKSILELQPFRRTTSIEAPGISGAHLTVTLVELNPGINAWYLLTVQRDGGGEARTYHLENVRPGSQRVSLSAAYPQGLRLIAPDGSLQCPLWSGAGDSPLEQARKSSLPGAPLCGGRLTLRNRVPGTYTNIERITNILRDHVWGGDKIVGFVREQLFKDAFIERGDMGGGTAGATAPPASAQAPEPAMLDESRRPSAVKPEHLAIGVVADGDYLQLGAWYPVRDLPGIFLSVVQPAAIRASITSTYRGRVNALDEVESGALDYLVAIDLSQYDLAFELGTDHPRVGWSERALESVRNPRLPGPDGIGTSAPVVLNGIVPASEVARTAVAFAGGFKREHGAFRYGSLALQNFGSHYGFIEQGVIFSKLQPGLATLFVTADGVVHMKTWTAQDDALLGSIRHARQNGVPLIELDAASGQPVPGPLVNQWGPGNWSGSSDERLRTLRAGACIAERGGARHLIYGYFSTATPSAMARVFQAYGCRYAMHLDMNALEHTYFAVYTHHNGQIVVQHLIEGMSEVDRKGGDELAPRFLSFPDDRDFFYLTRRGSP